MKEGEWIGFVLAHFDGSFLKVCATANDKPSEPWLRLLLTSKELLLPQWKEQQTKRVRSENSQSSFPVSSVCWCFRTVSFAVISFDQELQQQLIIETRDLKKTRNFYQKLIQQERKSKGGQTASSFSNHRAELRVDRWSCACLQGPESKSMLLKLKSQFEELRSRVVLLECVKKYLEVETQLPACLSSSLL